MDLSNTWNSASTSFIYVQEVLHAWRNDVRESNGD